MKIRWWSLTVVFLFALGSVAIASGYKVAMKHKGGDLTPQQAYEMAQADPAHAHIVDVRTRVEYQDIGHPVGACNIPLKFYTTQATEKGYKKTANKNFVQDLKARFNPATDTLMFICRSGKRSCEAATAAVEAGFPAARVFNVMGGVEGDKVKDKASPMYGQRMVNGWKNDKLPWTYHMAPALMYQPDLASQ